MAGLQAAWHTLVATREGLPLAPGEESGAAPLELLTAHSAKGLEREQVWLLGCQQSTWWREPAERGFRLPPALAPHPTMPPSVRKPAACFLWL